MSFQNTAHDGASNVGPAIGDHVRGICVVLIGAALVCGLALGVMQLLTAPDGWVMKAASQAMTTAQQGTLASYDIADTH